MGDIVEKIPLSEMLAELRSELEQAKLKGEDSELKFQIEDIEIELQVGTTEGSSSGGGIKLWVFNADATVNASEAKTQKLKLNLKPIHAPDNKPIKVSGKGERGD